MRRFPIAKEPNWASEELNQELVEKIISVLKEAKVSYAEAYETLEAVYRTMEYRSKFLHL
ncbi:hypothetical protein M5X00_30375 [Paenibacillus alvei]|uniref:Uncharacterized protein n=1 Tax=Paenibacillus alvei TaxID=44250 RepID=A0ABT4H0X6_PAEAL|nr:hypothetical protein [Paenibacillus alvei]EJW14262.1 hypothetical protein PAV_15c00510 [Paenibacillus alvei DSM 29]MCY9545062.1 hypothetical protein [Paenibacillus alvei]MCY9708368.1 hypothetical protein [Paenibacillus alvei]MCY9738255.1 hypothetical protein [Paenibacillus alvei]MCY9758530.1 hypothetical protein [Paenibacillus alvei]